MYDDDCCDTPPCANCGKITDKRGYTGDGIYRYHCIHCTKITAITVTNKLTKNWGAFYIQ